MLVWVPRATEGVLFFCLRFVLLGFYFGFSCFCVFESTHLCKDHVQVKCHLESRFRRGLVHSLRTDSTGDSFLETQPFSGDQKHQIPENHLAQKQQTPNYIQYKVYRLFKNL